MIDYIKTHCYLRRDSPGDKAIIYNTGVGGFQFGKKFEEELNIE